MGPQDRDWLERCRRGDGRAREEFVRLYGGLVWWAVRKTLQGSPSPELEAEDLFQEVFRKVFEPGALDAVRDGEALKSWLTVLTCRLVLDARRLQERRRKRETPMEDLLPGLETESAVPGPETAQDPAPGPMQSARQAEITEILQAVLSKLTPRERACVRFRYFDGLTHARIGEIMGLPEDTVSTIVRRSREELKAALERRGYKEI